jgi:cysteinyl-tRNA synthetase
VHDGRAHARFPANSIIVVPAVRIRDTLSGEVGPLESARPPEVGIYACGPTVYSRIHVGNARAYVIPMLLRRLLAEEGFEVRLVINVTDINDKIYAAAREAGVPSAELAGEMTRAYVEDTDRLGLGRPDHEPLASETIPEIVSLIESLIEGGHAYESGGDVYFRVRSFSGYGKLSNRDPDQMDQGEEAGTESLKEDRLDFALWKAHKQDEDTSWPSPWGDGRPGWHIECSAMAEKFLGAGFAVHSGGIDLVFPHHENEIAQTEAARGEPLARAWMHNGMVRVAEEKMSKSLGNIFQLSAALDRYGAETVIAYLISGHYRQPLEFSEEALDQAAARVERIRNFALELPRDDAAAEDGFVAARRADFLDGLADDFNTPRALAALFELIAEGNRRALPGARPAVEQMLRLLGLESLLAPVEPADPQAERLMEERERARSRREFDRADQLRDELEERGWEVRDTPDGPRLVPKG